MTVEDDEDDEEDVNIAELVWEVPPAAQLSPQYAGTPGLPVDLYMMTLSETARPTQRSGLSTIARMMGGPLADVSTLPWTSIRYPHVIALRAVLDHQVRERVRSPATANRWLSAVRRVLEEAWLHGAYPREEFEKLSHVDPVLGNRAQAGRFIEWEEVEALLAVCEAETGLPKLGAIATRDAAVIAVLAGAGLRRLEVTRLRRQDVDPAGVLKVFGKFNKERMVGLQQWALNRVHRWTTASPGEALFCPMRKGGKFVDAPYAGGDQRKMLLKRGKLAGIEPCAPHDFRRSFISRLLDAGVDLASVQKIAGHSDPATTAGYDRRPFDVQRAAVEKLPVPKGGAS